MEIPDNVKIVECPDVLAECATSDDSNEAIILIHPDLKKDVELYNAILAHELKHAKSSDLMDIKIEAQEAFKFRQQLQVSKFLLAHPRVLWHQMFSFQTNYNGKAYFDQFKMFLTIGTFMAGITAGVLWILL